MKNTCFAGSVGLLLLGMLGISPSAIAAVGRTPGAFAVSSTGSGTYTIPIWAPPGPRGLQPNIALVYNSQSGSGVMGPGWSIAGLSSIYRCNMTFAQDAAPAPVAMTYADAFCLDGKRLRLTSSDSLNTYGQDDTTYQTEIADFSNVTAHGTAGNGPASFTVQGKNGLTYEYGVGGNSQVLAGSTAYVWMLDKVTDRAGNVMALAYLAPSATLSGATLPQTISWTPTTHGSSSYSYTMTFDYNGTNTPASSIFGYIGGNPVVNQDLLLDINVTNGSGTTIKKYFLTYDSTQANTRATRLKQVQECADSGGSNCLLPTTIAYQNGQSGVSTTPTTAVSGSTQDLRSHHDLNGDGIADLVYSNGSSYFVSLSSPSGFQTPIAIPTPTAMGDVLGTGAEGILAVESGVIHYLTYNSSSNSFTDVNTGISSTGGALVDVNGDGLPDLVSAYTAIVGLTTYIHIVTQINTSSGGAVNFGSPNDAVVSTCSTNCSVQVWLTPDFGGSGPLSSIDFNGDGRQDLAMTVFTGLVGHPATPHFYELLSNGTNYTTVTQIAQSTASAAPYFVNWNNDACTDVIWNSTVYISGCNGTAPATLTVPGQFLTTLDWDGDGKTDVLVANGSTIGVYLSTGSLSVNGGLSALQTTGVSYSSNCTYRTADVNGDGLDDLICWTPSAAISYSLHEGSAPDLVSSITDGFGNSVSTSYVSLAQSNYTEYFDAPAGYKNYIGPLYVVSQATFSDPSVTGATYNQEFLYYGAWTSLQGRGFAGFYEKRTYDSRNSLYDYQYYERGFPFTGMKFQDIVSNGSFNLSQSVGTPATLANATLHGTTDNERYFPYFTNWTASRREVEGAENGQLITSSSTDYAFDGAGNPTNVATTVTDDDPNSPYVGQQWTTTTATVVSPDTSANWCLGLPTQITVTKTSPGSSVTRTVSFPNPDYANCRPTSKVTEPNSSTYAVTEAYGYNDSFGNLTDVTVTGIGMTPRNTHTDWGTTGQFPMKVTNALSQATTYNYDFNLGFRTSVQDPNGIVISWGDDPFGRKTSEMRPDGTSAGWAYTDCASSGGCLIGSHATIVTETLYNTNQTVQTDGQTFLDSLDRPLVSTKRMLSGAYDRNERRYDSLGRVAQQAIPCTWSGLSAACPYWVTNTYDVLNRLTQSQRPISQLNTSPQITTIQYAGRTTVYTDPQGKQSTKIVTVAGTMGRSQDHDGYYQSFSYDGFGSLLSVTDSQSNTLFVADYDYGIGAFQRDATDMDLDVSTAQGQHRHYTYDALGELTNWQDAKGQSFSETYDALSRPLVRTEPDLTTSWTWGTTAGSYNIGKLQSVSANAYSESYSYDSSGRLASEFIAIPSDSTYEYDWSYSTATGLLDTLTYPTSTSSYRLKLQYGYQNGVLQSVSDFNAGTVYWQANATDSRGQVTQETLGNHVVTNRSFDAVTGWMGGITSGVNGGTELQNDSYLFDEVGNLTQRQNSNAGLTENFYADDLYRLDHSTLGSTVNLQMHYDATGNITARSDLAGGAAWIYDANRKHAVVQAGSPAFAYAYDADGNVTSRNGYAVTWTSYNHPSSINGSNGESVAFAYKHDHTRWSAVYSGSSGVETTYFIGDLLEKVTTTGPTYDYRHYIYAAGTKLAIYSRTSAGANTLHYVREDHLGGVSGIVNSDGTSYVKESFTAFGARRSSCTWSGPPTQGNLQAINAVTRHGFTWQTALGSMGLNDMNGRIQDAVTGRFLSPDPTIPDPGFTQSYNRYSYVNNNPLTFTDPTGFADSPRAIEWPTDQPVLGSLIGGGNGFNTPGVISIPGAQFSWGGNDSGGNQGDWNGNGGAGGQDGGALLGGALAGTGQSGSEGLPGVTVNGHLPLASIDPSIVSGFEAGLERSFAAQSQGGWWLRAKPWLKVGLLAASMSIITAVVPEGPGEAYDAAVAPELAAAFGEATTAEGTLAEAGALSDINALGGTMNCVACAREADLMLRGLPYGTASLTGPASISELGTGWASVSGEMEVGSILSRAGNGSTGIVFGESLSGGVGHVWNAVNNGGVINFLDAQAGAGGLGNFTLFRNFQFLLTSP